VPLHDAFPILQTVEMDQVVAFYVDRLGFEETYRFPEEGPPTFVVLSLGAFSLGLAAADEVAPPGRVALWFYSDDVDGEIEALRDAEVEVLKEPEDTEWGERIASVVDPDGNEVFIGQRLTR
jgi:lactoylglutathione lyase